MNVIILNYEFIFILKKEIIIVNLRFIYSVSNLNSFIIISSFLYCFYIKNFTQFNAKTNFFSIIVKLAKKDNKDNRIENNSIKVQI